MNNCANCGRNAHTCGHLPQICNSWISRGESDHLRARIQSLEHSLAERDLKWENNCKEVEKYNREEGARFEKKMNSIDEHVHVTCNNVMENISKRLGNLENMKTKLGVHLDSGHSVLMDSIDSLSRRLTACEEYTHSELLKEMIRGKYQEEWDCCTHKDKDSISCYMPCDNCRYSIKPLKWEPSAVSKVATLQRARNAMKTVECEMVRMFYNKGEE